MNDWSIIKRVEESIKANYSLIQSNLRAFPKIRGEIYYHILYPSYKSHGNLQLRLDLYWAELKQTI